MAEQSQRTTRLIPVTEWPEHHIWPTVAGLRNLILKSKEKGFDRVVKKANGRVLIDETAFYEWVERGGR